ncbi:MAG: HAD hydrolase-like protein [Chitinophagales bacterium]
MQHFIFDLDGTITHPQPGIVGGYRYAFDQLGFPDKTDEELIPLIGPPLKYVFSKIYHLSDEQTEAGIRYYREYYYGQGGMYEAIIFEGMKELFQSLRDKNKTLHIATNKALQVDKILAHFDVLEYFTTIEHYNEEKGVTTKEKMIENIIQQHRIQHKHHVVMIGDREHDLSAARNMGIQAVGVLYGFGTKAELEKCLPKYIVHSVSELHSVLHQF